uniref:Molybdenum cofactor synthesis 2 n=1 Tax=Cyprinus carpio TaxID=7962 RepID=A0A8C2HS32_CYPCA
MNTEVSVLYFAKSAELTGLKADDITVPSRISSLQRWQDLESRHPRSLIILTNLTLILLSDVQINDIYTASHQLEKAPIIIKQKRFILPLSPPVYIYIFIYILYLYIFAYKKYVTYFDVKDTNRSSINKFY